MHNYSKNNSKKEPNFFGSFFSFKILPKDSSVVNFLFYLGLIPFALFYAYSLFNPTLFADGLNYAALSIKLSKGNGNIFSPYHNFYQKKWTDTPAVALGFNSVFYSVFGYSWITDKLISLFLLITNLGLTLVILKKIAALNGSFFKNEIKLFLALIGFAEVIYWGFSNLMLESWVLLFTQLSIYLFILNTRQYKTYYTIIGSSIAFITFLIKLFYPLLSLGFYPIYLLVKNKKIGLSFALEILKIAITLLVLFTIFYFTFPAYQKNINDIINTQILPSLLGQRDTDNNLHYYKHVFVNFLVPIVLFIVITLKFKKQKWTYAPTAISFVLTGLLATLVIGLMPKHGIRYAMPFVYLTLMGFSLLYAEKLTEIKLNLKLFKTAKFIGLASLILMPSVKYFFFNTDTALLNDLKKLRQLNIYNSSIHASPSLYHNYKLTAHLDRFNFVYHSDSAAITLCDQPIINASEKKLRLIYAGEKIWAYKPE